VAWCSAASRDVALPFVSPMFGDHMVLQRGKTNTIWGWAKPRGTVRVEIAGQTAAATVGRDGRWEARISPPASGAACTVRITGPQTVEFKDVLVGDVWLCGGQSNMEFPLSRSRNGEEEVRAANHPEIRLFTVKPQPAYSPAMLVQGSWKVCSPKTVTEDGGVSAVGFFFARRIQSETNVPIGLIKDCWGGTPAESWTGADTLRPLKDFDFALDEVARLRARGGPEYGNYISHWYDEFDPGQKNNAWAAPGLDDRDWKPVTIPGGFRELGVPEAPAVCYFRKSVVLPDPLPAGNARIFLGVIEKMDTTQVNGRWVGASAWVENPRAYNIDRAMLKPGTNVITVRVRVFSGESGSG
jgi:sialate O-acetylesterase